MKFKAYSHKLKRMFAAYEIKHVWNERGQLTALVGAVPSCVEYDPAAVLIECTGFNDSKGTYIYDGDVLESTYLSDEGEQPCFCQVYWNESAGCWAVDSTWSQNKDDYSLLSETLNSDSYTVVGSTFTHTLVNCMQLIKNEENG